VVLVIVRFFQSVCVTGYLLDDQQRILGPFYVPSNLQGLDSPVGVCRCYSDRIRLLIDQFPMHTIILSGSKNANSYLDC